jgi:hypothetical protein
VGINHTERARSLVGPSEDRLVLGQVAEVVAVRPLAVASPAVFAGAVSLGLDVAEEGAPIPEAEAKYVGFTVAYDKASAQAENTVLGNLYDQTRDYPTAAVSMLKLRWPQRYAERQSLEVSGPRGAPIAITPALAKIPRPNWRSRSVCWSQRSSPRPSSTRVAVLSGF